MKQERRVALVVEDDETIRESLLSLLELERYEAHAAATLDEARACIRSLSPSVLVVDRMLPDGMADELLDELSDRPSAPSIVLVSASPGAPDVAQSYGVDCVAKPFDVDGLLATVERTLKSGKRPSRPPPPG